MVVFTCNNCGESLQKPKVDKHYQTVCRRGKNLTCVDCFKDFRGEEYVAHIKCLTENERYSAKGSMPNGDVKKGELKQESWTDMIRSIIDKEENLSADLRNMLNIVGSYVNVPRKKVKFINFITNSFGRNYDRGHIETIWDLIEKYKSEQIAQKKAETQTNGTNGKQAKETNGDTKQNGELKKRKAESNNNEATTEEEVPTKKTKKSKKNGTATDTDNQKENNVNGNGEETKTTEETDKFSYEKKIIEVLNAKKQISLNKLQKKVLSAYVKHHGVEEHSEKQVKKFNQKLKKLPNVEIKDDLVTLT